MRLLAGITMVNRSMFATGPKGEAVTDTYRPLRTDVALSLERAVTTGTTPLHDPEHMFWGDRYARPVDPCSHHWLPATPGPGSDAEAVAGAQINKMFYTP
jgi:uncharacterized glyoxalase superfamily protein PhnB